MAQLIVRNIDASLVQRLKERAARNGRSAEAEHRVILRAALAAPDAGRRRGRGLRPGDRLPAGPGPVTFLVDTDVVSELRKGSNGPDRGAHPGSIRDEVIGAPRHMARAQVTDGSQVGGLVDEAILRGTPKVV